MTYSTKKRNVFRNISRRSVQIMREQLMKSNPTQIAQGDSSYKGGIINNTGEDEAWVPAPSYRTICEGQRLRRS
jgi:hypothetical protein